MRPADLLTKVRARSRSLSLRARLLIGVVGLFAVASAVIGGVTTILLRQYLIGQLDANLSSAVERTQRSFEPNPNGPGGSGPPGLQIPGQGPGTLVAMIVDDQITAATLDSAGQLVEVPVNPRSHLLEISAGDDYESVDLGRFGDYRVAAVEVKGRTFIVGLPLEETQRTIGRLVLVELGVAAAGLAAAGFVGAGIIGSNLRPLRRVAATATRISEQPLDKGEVATLERVAAEDADPRTEVGQVGAAFNQMLGHVERSLEARQASETRVRHFVADASHELRTPLAAIRGYAELTRRGRDEVPPDIAHALSRVESESARMTTLVEDLLLLARIDSGRPLSREPVDLTALLIDRVSDAHATAPEFNWSLDLPEESVVVPGDEQRLHQVVANLLANARTHTPPGTTVKSSLQRHGDSVVLQVRDDGPGIPVEFQPEIFERFVRGDSSRSRANGSTGLGLAIVAAVVHRHDGTVEVASVPGSTTFTVTLPTT